MRIEVRIMKLENRILKISVVGALFFALFGIAWGWAIDSDMIIFDGWDGRGYFKDCSHAEIFIGCVRTFNGDGRNGKTVFG